MNDTQHLLVGFGLPLPHGRLNVYFESRRATIGLTADEPWWEVGRRFHQISLHLPFVTFALSWATRSGASA